MFDYFLTYAFDIIVRHFFYFRQFTSHNDLLRTSFGAFPGGKLVTTLLKFRDLTTLLTSRVSCPSPWARQNLPVPLKIKQTLSL